MRYTVKKGDTLHSISEKYYGKGWLWRVIFHHGQNRHITNPSEIKIGQTIYIPFRQKGR